ncbi:MAG: hypothetical protein JXB30_12275 [Anaerolineae bacterium]|nr:hypothetical protein [Anaerolineae bacterium]
MTLIRKLYRSFIMLWLHFKRRAIEAVLVLRTLLFRTDVKRWQLVAKSGSPSWDERNQCISDLIPENSSVLDLGAGPQTLRGYLSRGCIYQPCDVVKISDDVLLCDFNAGIYPQIEQPFDFVVCSGVLEYMRTPLDFLATAAALGNRMILTYAPVNNGNALWMRLAAGWVNHLRQEQLENLLDQLELQWSMIKRWNDQVIYEIHRPSSDGHGLVAEF